MVFMRTYLSHDASPPSDYCTEMFSLLAFHGVRGCVSIVVEYVDFQAHLAAFPSGLFEGAGNVAFMRIDGEF